MRVNNPKTIVHIIAYGILILVIACLLAPMIFPENPTNIKGTNLENVTAFLYSEQEQEFIFTYDDTNVDVIETSEGFSVVLSDPYLHGTYYTLVIVLPEVETKQDKEENIKKLLEK